MVSSAPRVDFVLATLLSFIVVIVSLGASPTRVYNPEGGVIDK